MVKVIALLKRKKGMSREEFEQRWLRQHTELSRKLPRLKGYRINIAISNQSQDLKSVDEPIYDGTAELWWDSLEEMQEDFDSPEAQAAVADADTFTIVRTHIYTKEYILK